MRAWALAALALVGAALGCASTAEVPWSVELPDPALRDRAAVIETTVRRGGCEGVLVYRASIGDGAPGPAPALGRGLHGFAAEARDPGCTAIARACIERDLPLPPGARVALRLEPIVPVAACPAGACRDGECDGEEPIEADAGPPITPDGGADAAVPGDAGAPADAAPPDAQVLPCAGATFGGHCYEHHAEPVEWSAAEAICVAGRAHLASLGGPDEESAVRAIAGSEPYWIGLTDLAVEGVWQWIDGSTSSHRDWAGGSPSNRDRDDCVRDAPGVGWTVARCREAHRFVCER